MTGATRPAGARAPEKGSVPRAKKQTAHRRGAQAGGSLVLRRYGGMDA